MSNRGTGYSTHVAIETTKTAADGSTAYNYIADDQRVYFGSGGAYISGSATGALTMAYASLSTSIAAGGDWALTIADSTVAGQEGGDIDMTAGKGYTTGGGGDITQTAGQGGATGAGGDYITVAGAGGATSGTGGSWYATAGAGTNGNADGGSMRLRAGNAHGSGTDGTITIGDANTSALTIGATGILTTFPGAVTITQTLTATLTGTATNATNTAITDDTTTAATMYPTWVTANTGNLPQKVTSTKLSFRPDTGVLTATGFAGALTGNVTGNCSGSSGSCTGNSATATTATNATNSTVTDDTTTAATMYPVWVTANTGNLPLKLTSTKLSFRPDTGILTATGFAGDLTGNVTGNVSGSSGSCTGNSATATTATNATNVGITDDTTTAATMYPTWVTANTGSLPAKCTSTKLSFRPDTGVLTATGFAGALTGNVTGNCSGSSGTCTGNAGSATYASAVTVTDDTTTAAVMYPLWATAVTGNLATYASSTKLSFRPDTGVLTATGFAGALTGNVTGNVSGSSGSCTGNAATATTATNATNIGITDDTTTAATMYPVWATAATGSLPGYVSSTKLSFRPDTGVLTATGFSGPLTGNVTGNASGSSGTCTGNAGSATYSSASTITDDTTTNATMYPLWVTAATGNLATKVSSTKFMFNPSTGIIETGGLNLADDKAIKFGTGTDVQMDYDGTDNVLDVSLGAAGMSYNITKTATDTCTEGRVIQVNSTTVKDADVDLVDVLGICRVGAAAAASATIAISGACFGVADAAVGDNRPLKSCSGGRLGEMIDSVNAAATIKLVAAGAAFTNQPANDSVSIVSTDAGDTQNATIYGTTNGTDTVVVEVKALNGLAPVTTTKLDWGEILGIELSSAAVGTITFSETSGGLAITTIAPLGTSKGVETVAAADQRAFNGKPTIESEAATTKQIGLVGTGTDYSALTNNSKNLNDTTPVSLGTAMNTVTKVLVGDLEAARSVTVKVQAAEDDTELRIARSLAAAAAKDDPIRVFVEKGI